MSMVKKGAKGVTCALCGHLFNTAAATSSCQGCPMHSGCAMICCPHCGYTTAPESRMIRLIRRLLGRL